MEIDCGISRARLSAWLDDELRLESSGGRWTFACGDGTCQVTLSPLEDRPLGGVSIERTLLSAEGDKAAEAEFKRLFTFRFASAGG